MSKARSVYPISLDPVLDAKITAAASALGLPKSEVMRLAMAIGLEKLRQVNYDLAGCVLQAADHPPAKMSLVAEPEGNESSPSTPAPGVRYPKPSRKKSS